MSTTAVSSASQTTPTDEPTRIETRPLYLFPLLILLFMVVFSSALLIGRNIVLHRRLNRQIAAAIQAGMLLPDGVTPAHSLVSSQPQLWDVQIRRDEKLGFSSPSASGGGQPSEVWKDVMPLSATVLRPKDHASKSTPPKPTTSRGIGLLNRAPLLSNGRRRQAQAKPNLDKVPEVDTGPAAPSKLSLAFLIAMPTPDRPPDIPTTRERYRATSPVASDNISRDEEQPLVEMVFGTTVVDWQDGGSDSQVATS